MKPRYKTGDWVSYRGRVLKVVRAVMECEVLYDLENGARVAEKYLVKEERDGKEDEGALPGDRPRG